MASGCLRRKQACSKKTITYAKAVLLLDMNLQVDSCDGQFPFRNTRNILWRHPSVMASLKHLGHPWTMHRHAHGSPHPGFLRAQE